ncbi:TauD/TfdA family dioxygenase [Priestia megaterium]|uniref:TauD/TfdA family dioxygenase n=1 Tax=Priestia megaterium TaxID=1404 RepID=UPI002782E357|nr:TauD/TfdA family dioxygenase [Priestia megaterium]MDQ0802599.1 hypothetical protein [Priestia megaterium]
MLINKLIEPIYTHKFSSEDLSVVQIKNPYEISTSVIRELINRYCTCGFVILEFKGTDVGNETFEAFSRSLGLGNAYTPEVYNDYKSLHSEHGFNVLTQRDNEDGHKAFNTSSEQEIHSDGTLEKIGFIKTTLLYCKSQGESGGENTIYNSVGAFYHLLKTRFDIAKLLFDERCLKRASNINNQEYIGPAFSIQENKIISRFSLDNTCDWNYGFMKIPKLEEAYSMMKDLANHGSPYFVTCKLMPGQAILMANDKISHGRKKFYNSGERKREMIRGLFLDKPNLNKGEFSI